MAVYYCAVLSIIIFRLHSSFGTFQWKSNKETNEPSESFGQYLRKTYSAKTDKFYVFMGDPQYWYECTPDNKNCILETGCSITEEIIRNDTEYKRCRYLHSEYANRVQQRSISQMENLIKSIGSSISGIVVNGDLVMTGNNTEIKRLKDQWVDYFRFPVYLGLGNHDYMNNIGLCPNNDCLSRILLYFIHHIRNHLNFSMDVTITNTTENGNKISIVNGSLSYSWNECFQNGLCLHFVQLNYFPYYQKVINGSWIEWRITSSLEWLKHDLDINLAKPIVINFHAFDNSYTELEKHQLLKTFQSFTGLQILAVTFAHVHEKIGVREYWCINGRKVPLVYTGSVPGNNYLLVQFSSSPTNAQYSKIGIKDAFQIHAFNDTFYTVDKMRHEDHTCQA